MNKQTKRKGAPLLVWIDPAIKEQVRAHAADRRRGMAAVVEDAVKLFFASEARANTEKVTNS